MRAVKCKFHSLVLSHSEICISQTQMAGFIILEQPQSCCIENKEMILALSNKINSH